MVVLVLALAIVGGAAYAAGSIIRVASPESPSGLGGSVMWIPSLPPFQQVHYRPLDPARAGRESGYAIAYLREPPFHGSSSVGVDILPNVGWEKHESGPQPRDPRLRGLAIA
ncbi:MAG: hypothetical protein ACRDFX_12870, partial [Chloroflexota bacterium]